MAIKLTDREYNPFVDDYKCEFIVDADSDFENLPKACTGSTAVSITTGNVRIVNTSGIWVEFGG